MLYAGETTRYTYDRAGQRTRMQSGGRDVQYYYGKNNELTYVKDGAQGLEARYEYDSMMRETRRTYGNGVRQETVYDAVGRVILIKETDSQNRLLRAEGYLYDEKGRRSRSVDEEGRVTKYEYNNKSRLASVLYPWTAEKANADRKEAGLYFTPDKGLGQRYTYSTAEVTALRELLDKASPSRGNAVQNSQMVWLETYTYDRNGNRSSKTTPWGTVRYEYDAFGTPYSGDLSGGMNLGYTGKPYDVSTGLYDYGYRDYSPQAARFTTTDPIRDGNNWYAYVNNDPVNYIDLWGPDALPMVYAMRLSYLQGVTRTADMYQKGGGGRWPSATNDKDTFCNQATYDVAEATGFNTFALYKGVDRDNVLAATATANLAEAAKQGTVIKVNGGQAQTLANMGYTVIAAGNGHLATVATNFSPTAIHNYSDNYDPKVSNVGPIKDQINYNKIMSANAAFGITPTFYVDPRQNPTKFTKANVAQRQER